MYMWKSCS